ncbi:MAG: hypothetical protein ACTSVW_00395 [Candidatus Njordarchaeales archaeon]
MVSTEKLIKAGTHATGGGLAGFLMGLGIQSVVEASGLLYVATVPVAAILPIFTVLSVILGFTHGMLEK